MNQIYVFAGVGLVALLAIGFMITRLYVRATKTTAFVRTGMGGEKVVLNGGAIVFPVLHETMRVGMNTVPLEVKRENDDSLITKDSMLVNVHAQFFVRVAPNAEAISKAAQTLGARTMDPGALKGFIESKFVDALRNVAASMTMDDLNQKRGDFVQQVQAACQHDLASNGLELETVSLTSLNQTDKTYFNPNNAFHAEGLTQLTKRTSARAQTRNEIEADTRVAIEQKNLEAAEKSFTIAQSQEFARLDQEKQVKQRGALQAAEVAQQAAEQAAIIAAAQAQGEQAAEQARIAAKQTTETQRISTDQAIALARQLQSIAVAQKSGDESKARAEADNARALAVVAAQAVTTAEATATAEREKAVQLVEATRVAETTAIGITVQAKAEKQAAEDRAAALLTTATADAEAEKVRASGTLATYEAEAAGKRALLEAENLQSAASMEYVNRGKLLAALPDIIRESVKPMENIDRISIADFGGGMPGTVHGGGSESPVGGGNLAEQAVNAALRYRTQAPLVDSLLGELGINLGGNVLVPETKKKAAPAPLSIPATAE